MSVLLGEDVSKFIEGNIRIQPAGVEVVPKKIYRIPIEKIDYGIIDGNIRGYYINGEFKNLVDLIEEIKPIENYWILDKGIYYLVFPKVKIPKDCIALALPRSTFNRIGLIKIPTALFDPGYEGEFTQQWYIPFKIKVNVNEAWIQLIFIRLEKESKEEYKGYWQKEKY